MPVGLKQAAVRSTLSLALLGATVLASNASSAQHCAGAAPTARRQSGRFELGLHTEAASFRGDLLDGSYQGLALTMRAELGRGSATARLPAYSVRGQGRHARGFGDTSLEGWWRAVGSSERGAGAALSVILPTGADAEGLGMGHAMAAPGLWGRVVLRALSLTLQGHHAVALGDGAADHREHPHGARGVAHPVVDPMSRSELAGMLRASHVVRSFYALELGVYGAFPTFDSQGSERLAVFGGPDLDVGELTFAGRLHVPITGQPFLAKLGLGVTWRI